MSLCQCFQPSLKFCPFADHWMQSLWYEAAAIENFQMKIRNFPGIGAVQDNSLGTNVICIHDRREHHIEVEDNSVTMHTQLWTCNETTAIRTEKIWKFPIELTHLLLIG